MHYFCKQRSGADHYCGYSYGYYAEQEYAASYYFACLFTLTCTYFCSHENGKSHCKSCDNYGYRLHKLTSR